MSVNIDIGPWKCAGIYCMSPEGCECRGEKMCEENVNAVADANPAALRPKYRVTGTLNLFANNDFETVEEALVAAQRLLGEGYTAVHIIDNDDADNQW